MGVTVDVLLNTNLDATTRVDVETGVVITVGVGLTVAASTDRTVGARSGGGAATPAVSQPITAIEATIARTITGSDPR